MNEPTLTSLLTQADDAAPPPPVAPGLARVVRARAAARARRQVVAASLCVPMVAVALVMSLQAPRRGDRHPGVTLSTRPTTGGPTAPVTAANLKAESERLALEAARHQAAAESLDALRRRRDRATWAREVVANTDTDAITRERNRAALSLLDHGDRLRRDLKQPDAAMDAYRRTIELFPDTHWAGVAKQRIDQLKPDARGSFTGPSLS